MAAPDWYEKTNKTFGDILDETATKQPGSEIIVYQDQRITYQEFQHSVNQLARGLLEIGVRKGERATLWMTNCPEWMIAQCTPSTRPARPFCR